MARRDVVVPGKGLDAARLAAHVGAALAAEAKYDRENAAKFRAVAQKEGPLSRSLSRLLALSLTHTNSLSNSHALKLSLGPALTLSLPLKLSLALSNYRALSISQTHTHPHFF